jgi:small subunit ribosomal protein S6
MRKYEVMLILPAEADDAVVNGAVERISKVIGEADGEVTNTDVWGRRRLAYPIDKHAEGVYAVVDMTTDPASLTELERELHLADDVVRFKVTVKPPPRKRKAPVKVPAAVGAGAEVASPADQVDGGSELAEADEPDAAEDGEADASE